MERVQIFILAEGLKIEFFFALSGRESSLVQTFCESCEQLDITHPCVHMTRRFVIQGCPTLNVKNNTAISCLVLKLVALTSITFADDWSFCKVFCTISITIKS